MLTAVAVRRGVRSVYLGLWSFLERCQQLCAEISGIRRALLAMSLGFVAVAALPPVHFIPALVPAFVGLAWLVAACRTWRGACWIGWCFGFGYFCGGLYWIANALLTKPEEFGVFIPVAVGGLSALLAGFTAIGAGLASMARGKPVSLVFALAGGWAIAEWLRSFVLTGFPWNLIGSVWTSWEPMLQVTSVVGPYGLALLTVAAAAIPSVLIPLKGRPKSAVAVVLGVYLCLVLTGVGGAARLSMAGPPQFVDGVQLRLVQPNIPQTLKWVPELRVRHVEDQIHLGALPADVPPTHIIWAEVAAPLFLGEFPRLVSAIGARTPADGLTLLGTLRRTPRGEPLELWNSLWAIDSDGRVIDTYDKAHLVPFGEYVPFREILGIGSVAGGATDFTPGSGPRTLRLPATPAFSPLICYEVIFPRAVVDDDDRPRWILNVTNDAWYGYSAGPFQHLAAARMRAVEEGLPLIRVANTGISAIIDPYGRVIRQLGLEERGVVDGPLPQAVMDNTIYGTFGNVIPLSLAALMVFWPLLGARKLDV